MRLEEALLLFVIVFFIVFFSLLFIIAVIWFLYRLYRIRISPKRTGTQEELIADIFCKCFQRKTLIVRKPFAKSSVFCRCGKFIENLENMPQDGIYILLIKNTSQSFDIVFQERFHKDPLYILKIQKQDWKSIRTKTGYYHNLTGRIGFSAYLNSHGFIECRGCIIAQKNKDPINPCFRGIYKTKWRTGYFELFLSTIKLEKDFKKLNNYRNDFLKQYPKKDITDSKMIHEKSGKILKSCYPKVIKTIFI